MSYLLLYLVVCLAMILASTKASNRVCNATRILVNSDAHYEHCMNYYNSITHSEISCCSLQDALDLISSVELKDAAGCILFDIILNSSEHYITKPINTTAHSVHISSPLQQKPAIVQCDFNGESFYLRTGHIHTLYFNKSDSVMFSNIIMEGCPFPMRIDSSSNVILQQSLFRYFDEAVFDIHNSLSVTVRDCIFINNTGTGIVNEQYRGNTGGLSITYNRIDKSGSNPVINITNCNFTNNSAIPKNDLSSDQTFGVGVLKGRGGGMGVFVREDYFNISAQISHCNFSYNSVKSFGGGMYILFNGKGSHETMVEHSTFLSNMAKSGGAGLILVGADEAKYGPHVFTVRQCQFKDNRAAIGGGLYYSINLGNGATSVVHIEESMFVGNDLLDAYVKFGAALVFDIAEDFGALESFHMNSIKDCLFQENIGVENSIVSIGFQFFNMSGTNRFISNKGSTLRIVGSTVIMGGVIEFMNNSATDGAALVLLSQSQMKLEDNLQLLFQNNSGMFGASIFVSAVEPLFLHAMLTPQCFIQLVSDRSLPPSQWNTTGINITFTGNVALFGSAIYATSLVQCSWVSYNHVYDMKFFPKWPIFTFRNDNRNDAFSDSNSQVHSVVTNSVDLKITMAKMFRGWPGENLTFSIQPLDELGNPTGALSRIYFKSNNGKVSGDISIVPNTLLISSERLIGHFVYYASKNGILTPEDITGEIILDHIGVSYSIREGSSRATIPFYGENCIGGYSLVEELGSSQKSCQCEQIDNRIILCEQDQDSIIIKDRQWAFHSSSRSGPLFFYLCPFGYCRCFLNASGGQSYCVNVYTNSYTDRQCVCGRRGILCGECVNESMTVSVLLNTCTTCDSRNATLIPVLILLVIIIVGTIVIVDVPLPHWCYPFLFYLQIVPLASLHFPSSFIALSRHLMYIGSSLSLFFPYDFCLHNGLSILDTYSIKYIPGTIVLIITPVVLLIRYLLHKYYSTHSLHSFCGDGVWTVLLLVFTQTLYTSANILHCPSIPDDDGNKYRRWYLNGSLECFSNDHTPLAVFAIFWGMLSILLIATVIIFSYRKSNRSIIVKKLSTSMKKPFRHYCSFWYGIELSRRLISIIIIGFFPDSSALLLLFIMALIVLYGYCRPYVNDLINILEITILITFLMLLMLRVNHFLEDMLQVPVNSTLSSIPSCDNEKGTTIVTTFATILLVIYYIPVVFGLLCLVIWIAFTVRTSYIKILQFKQLRRNKITANNTDENDNSIELYNYEADYHNTDHMTSLTNSRVRKPVTTVTSTNIELSSM